MCRSPALIFSAICSTASSNVRRVETGSNGRMERPPLYGRSSSSCGGLMRRAASTRSSAWRSATSSGVLPSAAAVGDRPLEALHRALDAGALGRAVAVPLARDVDQAAAVGEEVGHVEDAALASASRATVAAGERVVGGARDDPGVDRARRAPRRSARRPHRARARRAPSRGSPPRTARSPASCSAAKPLAALGVEVAADHARAGAREPAGERAADLAEPDHADAASLELVRAGRAPRAPRRVAAKHALGRDRRGVAGAAVRPPSARRRSA